MTKEYRIILVTLIVGLAARFVLMPITSSPFDIGEGWAAIIDSYYVGDDLYTSGWYLYPPIWGYILSILGGIAQLLGMTSFGDVFIVYPDRFNCIGYNFVTNLGFNTLVKVPALIFDLATAYLCYKVGMRFTSDHRKASICFALWFLCPVTIMASAILGMFDSIIVFFLVLSLLTFFEKRYFMTGMLIALGGLTKFFPFMLLPIMGGYVLSDRSQTIKGRVMPIISALIGIFVVFVVVYLPVIINGQLIDSLTFITMRTDAASSGFSYIPTFNNITYYLPILIVAYVALFLAMFFVKGNRDTAFLWLYILTFVPIFSLPYVSYTPTYGIILVPAAIVLYCLKGKIAMIPWFSLLIFPLHGVMHYWGQMFYPLGAFTDIIDLSAIPESSGFDLFYIIVLHAMCLSGISFLAIIIYLKARVRLKGAEAVD